MTTILTSLGIRERRGGDGRCRKLRQPGTEQAMEHNGIKGEG